MAKIEEIIILEFRAKNLFLKAFKQEAI